MSNDQRRLTMIYAGLVTYSLEAVPRPELRDDAYQLFVVWSKGSRSPTRDEAIAAAYGRRV